MKNKSAAIQISLSWLFMIIIGTFFIIMAYNIIANYKSVEDAKSSLILQQTLSTILNNAGRTAGIEQSTLIPLANQATGQSLFQNKKVEILCNNGLPIFSVNGNLDPNDNFLRNYPTGMTVINEKSVSNTYLAVESFKMPFKITNILSFVSTKNLILFDKNSAISKKLIYKFSKSYPQLNFRSVDFSQLNLANLKTEIKKNSYSSIVFVSDNNVGLGGINLNDFNIYSSHVQVAQDDGGKYGTINIADNQHSKSRSYKYIDTNSGLSIITMAIFSRMDTFNCSYNLLIKSIVPVYNYYIQKAGYFENLSKTQTLCPSLNSLSQQGVKYSIIKNSLQTISENISKNQNIYNAQNLSKLLGNLNANMLSLENFNCPYIY